MHSGNSGMYFFRPTPYPLLFTPHFLFLRLHVLRIMEERRWPACRNSGAGTAAPSVRLRACFFNIP